MSPPETSIGPAFPASFLYQDVLPEVLLQERRQDRRWPSRLTSRPSSPWPSCLPARAPGGFPPDAVAPGIQRGPRCRLIASSSGVSRNPT